MENVLHAPAQRRGGNRTATLAACVLAAFALLAVVMAGIALYGQATVTDFTAKNLGPSFEHPFGTDWMGRDMLARTLAGLSTSVLVGLLAAGVSSVIALVLGCAAALGGKRVDAVVSWLIDLMMGVPHIVLLVLISLEIGYYKTTYKASRCADQKACCYCYAERKSLINYKTYSQSSRHSYYRSN